jgi:hypothetical protein
MPYQPAVLGPNTRLNNFRLNYLTAAQAAERPTYVRIILGGIDITRPDADPRVIYKSVQIQDVVHDAPNTCRMTIYGSAAPHVGQPLEVWINSDAPQLLFGGELQTVDRTYKGRPSIVFHPVTAIDDTAAANRRRPLMPFVNVSASTIAQTLITTYCPGFSTAGIEAGLPAVSVNFDGSEGGMKGCLTALAKLIGGYWYFEHKTLYFFVTPPGTPPDPIDDTPGRFLHDPQIRWTMDKSQVRTRVYGKGASTRIAASIAANTDLVPVDNGEMFNPAGGKAIAGLTPDGAASRVVTYTGVQLGSGGGLVGPGAAPSAAPGLAVVAGAGVESGLHQYAITFTTAAGESLAGPVAAITVGVTPPPAVAPNPGTPQTGGAIDAGTHQYGVTFLTAAGETTLEIASAPVTINQLGSPAHTVTPPTAIVSAFEPGGDPACNASGWNIGDQIYYVAVYGIANGGFTTPGPKSPTVTAAASAWGDGTGRTCPLAIQVSNIPTPPSGDASLVTVKRVYRNRNGAWQGWRQLTPGTTAYSDPGYLDGTGAPPSTNTATIPATPAYQTVPLTGILTGPANVTGRKIYRWKDAATSWRLVDTIANNTATTYTDTKANSALGAAPPATNTATGNRVSVTIQIGGSTVTGRKAYRTPAGGGALKLLQTIANNTTTTITDSAADATLGAGAPGTDTSGLVQPNGQVPAGSTSLILANPGPFADAGGWAVIGNGAQVIRYTGKSATALTGIPASGPGAIVASISYNSTVTAAPALVGVAGLVDAVIRNAPIHVWVQRDDPAAQSYMAGLDGSGDGVYEHIVSDERRTEGSLNQICDAQLQLYSRPLVSVTYASRDLKTKSGLPVRITLATPAIDETLTIQDVTITELGIPKLLPKFTVTAGTAHQSLEAVLRMLIRKADA